MSNNNNYEICLSVKQELSFSKLKTQLAENNLEYGTEQLKTLKLIGEDGLYTNLALLLSDQCEHTLKIAVFQGTNEVAFRNHREFRGSLLTQLEEGYAFLEENIKVIPAVEGLRGNYEREYPLEAVREALLNSIIHRDYSFTGSTLVKMYDNRIEFVSLGGLITGLSLEEVLNGISKSRNARLHNIFHTLKLAENNATGIRRIMYLYKDSQKKVKFESALGAFKTTIFNDLTSTFKAT